MTRPLSAVLARLIWLCMAPMVLLAVWLSWRHLDDLDEQQQREARNLARNFMLANDRYLDARLKALNILAISPLADDPQGWPVLYRGAQGFLESFGSHVIYADEQRQMLFNTREPYGAALPRLPLSKGRSAAPLALETGKPQVGDLILGPVANRPLVAIAVPVLRPGRPTRLMLTTLDTRLFHERIEQLALPAGWSIVLRDGTGADIARRSPPGFDGARDVDAEHRFVVRSELAAWSAVVEIPRAVDLADRREALLSLGASVLLAVGLGLAGGLLAGRRVSRQVASLAQPGGGEAPRHGIAEVEAARQRIADAGAELHASQERLRLWGETMQRTEVGVAITDARTNALISVNPAFARQHGYTESELVGQSVWNVFAPEHGVQAQAGLASREQAGHSVFESEHQRKDGSRFPVLIDLTVVRDPHGAPASRIGLVLDISDRKRAEQELAAHLTAEVERQRQARIAALNLMDDAQADKRRAEAAADELRQLSMAVEQSAESIQITDPDGRITYVNEAFLRQTGYARGEVIGRDLRFLQSGLSSDDGYAALWSAIGRRESWRGELHSQRKDGREFVEFAIATPIRDAAGQVTHHVTVKEDITEKKRMGAELDSYRHHLEELVAQRTAELEQARLQAESANLAKSTFLASMSHEIRTPINVIFGMTDMTLDTDLNLEQRSYLQRTRVAANTLLILVNDILDFARIEAKKMRLAPRPFGLRDWLGRTLQPLAGRAHDRGLEMACLVDDDVPDVVVGDTDRLAQVLVNLAGNAIQYTPQGSVEVRVRRASGGSDARRTLQFSVVDTGIGIAEEQQREIFDAFVQGEAARAMRSSGTGLGLAICSRLVRLMDGRIWVESEVGRGSRFHFTAPLLPATDEDASVAA